MDKRVLLIDDHAPMRCVLKIVIDSSPGLHVLDLAMPRMNGLDTARALHRMMPKAPIILFTFHKEVLSSRQVHDAGFASVVSKADQVGMLIDEIQRLAS